MTVLLNTLTHLRDLGNTVIVVEHDEEAILTADYIVDMGRVLVCMAGNCCSKDPEEISKIQIL